MKKKKKPEAWHVKWCKENVDELRRSGRWATIHPKHGVIMTDELSEIHLIGKSRFLKRSILKDCVRVYVPDMLTLVGPRRHFAHLDEKLPPKSQPKLSGSTGVEWYPEMKPSPERCIDLFETPKLELADYAKKYGLKATDVLMALLSKGMTGVHIHTHIDEDTVKYLDRHFRCGLEKL